MPSLTPWRTHRWRQRLAPETGSRGDERRRETLTARAFVRRFVRTEAFGLCNIENQPRCFLRLVVMKTALSTPNKTRPRGITASSDTSRPSDALEGAKEERVEFRASGGLLQILNELRDNYRLSRSESIRRAVALFFIAKREQKKGRKLAVIDNQGNVVSEIYSF